MNLRDLEYIIAVAEERHFGRAAERVHVSQPTLSMQIKKLEDYLGVALFERSNRQVLLTPVGEKIVARAQDIVLAAKELRDIARAATDPLAGELRLGAFPTLAPYLLPRVVPAITDTFPRLELLLIEEKTQVLLDKLREGKIDAALIALPTEAEGLESIPLFDDPFLLAVPAGHPLAKRASVSQKDLRGKSLLLLEEGHCLRSQALDVCSMIGASEKKDFRATSLETLRQMVAAGAGITLIPALAARKEDRGIAYIPFAGDAPSRTIGLLWRKNSPRISLFTGIAQLIKRLKR